MTPVSRRIQLTILATALLGALFAGAAGPLRAQDRPLTLGHPGYLILTAALDTTRGFSWRMGPAAGQRSLTWEQGSLVLPDTLELESMRDVDLLVPCTAELAGQGASGRLVFQDGIFPVSESLHLTDGVVDLYLTAGELEVRGQRIRYTAPRPQEGDSRAGFVFLAGMVLLVFVLLRRLAIEKRKRNLG